MCKCVIQPCSICYLTRAKVKEVAWDGAKVKSPNGNNGCVPLPLPHIDVNGLYILISEVDAVWMPKKLTKDPHACIQHPHKMLEDETLRLKISGASLRSRQAC